MANLLAAFLVCLASSLAVAQTNWCQLGCKADRGPNTACLRRNVGCRPGPDCGTIYQAITLSRSDKQLILKLHNEFRNKVASGRETRNKQPPAKNMNTLTYNDELAYVAQCLTNSCNYDHDKCRRTASYEWVGQNIGEKRYTGTKGDYKSVINSTIYSWYDEVSDFQPSWISSYGDHGVKIGHYTQVVWADTKEIGCGITYYLAKDENKYFFGCNYGPGGNLQETPVYKVGNPGSECQSRNQQYPALCA